MNDLGESSREMNLLLKSLQNAFEDNSKIYADAYRAPSWQDIEVLDDNTGVLTQGVADDVLTQGVADDEDVVSVDGKKKVDESQNLYAC